MDFGTLTLLAPLAAGFHPSGAACPTNCPPGPMLRPPLAGFPPAPGPLAPPCVPNGPPAQVLAAKVIVPAGVRTTALPGTPAARTFDAPTAVGLRPGDIYKLELAGLPGRPGETLYPEIEVRGSLVPRAGMNPLEYPAAIVFTEGDLEKAAAGTLITKVIYLEDPTKAVPVRTTADRPVEDPQATESDAIKAAVENGRVVMVVRIGNRKPTADELARVNVPNTILFPGDKHLGTPAAPPMIGWCGVMLYDPISGPKPPAEECFTDGGDTGPRLGIGPANRLGGLDATDVAAEYTQNGKRRVTTSNVVCVCVPRFAVQRSDLGLGNMAAAVRPQTSDQKQQVAGLLDRQRVDAVLSRLKLVGFDMRLRPTMHTHAVSPFTVTSGVAPRAVGVSQNTFVVASSVQPDETTNADGFTVTKSVDPKENVKIGDEVTFTLRFTNGTRQPITDVVLSDSLSPRLEFVPGSAVSDRPVNVTAEGNEVGSTTVRFEVPGSLQPGQSGTVKFKAKVR